ncbi:hypothetical protein ABKN59_011144 [Abortiporus biennis]
MTMLGSTCPCGFGEQLCGGPYQFRLSAPWPQPVMRLASIPQGMYRDGKTTTLNKVATPSLLTSNEFLMTTWSTNYCTLCPRTYCVITDFETPPTPAAPLLPSYSFCSKAEYLRPRRNSAIPRRGASRSPSSLKAATPHFCSP